MSDDKAIPNFINHKDLTSWHNEAYQHFSDLSKVKNEQQQTLFALEHPFSSTSVQVIKHLLSKDFAKNGINNRFWLLWVIYATEIGYEYVGEEYWDSFNEQLGHFSNSQREQLKSCFTEFNRKFSGVVPVGTWANRFSIIAQPITQAILPRDLQLPFAKLLFESRRQLSEMSTTNISAIGRLLASNIVGIQSSRFENFLEQEELVGKIAIALLTYSSTESNSLVIYSRTLKRIVEDLERKDAAKKWIKQTRGLTARMEGAYTRKSSISPEKVFDTSLRTTAWKVRPRMKVRLDNKGAWDIIINVSPWPKELLDSHQIAFLLNHRFQVPCAGNDWTPADNLRRVGVCRKLQKWPERESLLRFSEKQEMDNSIPDVFRLSLSSPPWVFKLGSDGTAEEVLAKTVRPGKSYLFLFEEEQFVELDHMTFVQINCDKLKGYLFTVPTVVSVDVEQQLNKLGIAVLKTLTLRSVGKPARAWDGEGYSEWLTTEEPIVSIEHDYDLEDIAVILHDVKLQLTPRNAGETSLIRLGKLPAGEHVVEVRAKSPMQGERVGRMLLNIREPITWTPGLAYNNGIHIFLDSIDGNLDSFLSGANLLHIIGTTDLPILIEFNFRAAGKSVSKYSSSTHTLPIGHKEIKEIVDKIRQTQGSEVADEGVLTIRCETIGVKSFRFTRSLKPLRWIYEQKNGKPVLWLLDQTIGSDEGSITFFDIQSPDIKEVIFSTQIPVLKDVTQKRGLFWAQKNGFDDGIIVSVINTSGSGLNSLIVSPMLSQAFNLLELLLLIEKWYNSRAVSFYAEGHAQRVIDVLVNKLYGVLCSMQWATGENKIIEEDLKVAIPSLLEQINNESIGNLIWHRISSIELHNFSYSYEVKWLLGAFQRCHLHFDEQIICRALAFSANPLTFISELRDGKDVRFSKDLLKVTRLFVLGLSQRLEPFRDYPLLMAAKSILC